MFIERFVPLFRLKIRISGRGLLILVIEQRADQMKRCAVYDSSSTQVFFLSFACRPIYASAGDFTVPAALRVSFGA